MSRKASTRRLVRSISDLEFARKIALDLLSVRQRSEAELREALAKRQVPEPIVDELCARFTEVGLLDDAKFAATLASSRSRFSQRGRVRIRQELRQKGVDDEVAAEAIAEISPDDELEAARAVAEKKMRSLRGLEYRVAQRRLAGVLARRGFSPDLVMRVTKEALVDLGDDD